MVEIHISTPTREVFVDITAEIEAAVAETAFGGDGVVHVYVPHTTAGVTINEGADSSVRDDIVQTLGGLVPRRGGYRHAEGNSDAHIKATLVGPQVSLLVQGGRLRLGTWQSVYLAEFDGPRSRKVWLEFTPGRQFP
jgi:secondary thiamine-phosphate synthase enzyme